MNAVRYSLLFLALFMVTGTMAADVSSRYDAGRTGDFSPVAGNMSNGRLLWKTWVGGFSGTHYSTPVVSDGVVYLGSEDMHLYAINAKNGTVLWRFHANLTIQSPAVADGRVFIGDDSGTLFAVDAATGTKLWEYNHGEWLPPELRNPASGQLAVYGSPVVSGGYLYFAHGHSTVFKIDPVTGAEIWRANPSNSEFMSGSYSSPAVRNGLVYFSTTDKVAVVLPSGPSNTSQEKLVALDTGSGGIVWSRYVGVPGTKTWESSPAVDSDQVIIGSFDNNVYSVDNNVYSYDAQSGAPLWSFHTGGEIYSSAAIANGTVYIGSNDGNIYALDETTGSRIWSFQTGAPVESCPSVANGIVYAAGKNNLTYAFNATSGEKIWEFPAGGSFISSPAISGDVVYIASGDGYLYAIGNASSDHPPVPEFGADFTTGVKPHTVHFTDRSDSLNTTLWSWDFGDGNWTNGTGPAAINPVHTYTFPGAFTVSLSLTNASGTNTTTKPDFIRVLDKPLSFDGPKITSIDVSPENPTTLHDVTFRAVVSEVPDYQVTGYRWVVEDASTGAGEWMEDRNMNPTKYRPAAGKYGNKFVRLTISYRDTVTGQIGFDVASKSWKLFFEKGTKPAWIDDNHDGIPNWFEYWKRDRAIAGIENFAYLNEPEAGEYNGTADTLHLGPEAPGTWPSFTINTPAGAEQYGGLVGINNTAASILHESNHKWVAYQWKSGGQFVGQADSDHYLDENDELPDFYENNVSHTRNNSTDTYNLAGVLASGYRTYGDQEYMCYRAESGYAGAITAGNDWSAPGLQTLSNAATAATAVTSVPLFLAPLPGATVSGGEIAGGFTDNVTDTDGNTLYNFLSVTAEVNVTRPGAYYVAGVLSDPAGQFVTQTGRDYELEAGTSPVSLDFDGKEIYHHGVNGPYNLSVKVYEVSRESFVIADLPDVYRTGSYLAGAFEGSQAYLSGTYSDEGADYNGDGVYEYLGVTTGVTVTKPGTYRLEGYLDTGNGATVVYAESYGVSSLPGSQQVLLQFSGPQIGASRKNGPYTLTSLALYEFRSGEIQFIPVATNTSAYQYTSFLHHASHLTGGFRDYTIDSDGDGLANDLAIDTGVTIGTRGTYIVSGLLSDANGTEISRTATMSGLEPGESNVTLFFSGADIVLHNVSGRYTLTTVMISQRDLGGRDSITDAFITQEYDYRNFNGPVVAEARFLGSPVRGAAPLLVQFTDQSTGSPLTWNWSFGDGNTSSSQNPSHLYTTPGLYTVSLNLTYDGGVGNSTTKPDFLTVTEPSSANARIGVFRNSHDWLLDKNGNGTWDDVAGGDVRYALGKAGDIAKTGDWNGDGYTEMGTIRLNTADYRYYWSVDYNGNGIWDGVSGGDQKWVLGQPGDIAIAGDWNHGGKTEMGTVRLVNTTLGVPGQKYVWSVDYNGNGVWDGIAGGDHKWTLGQPGDTPVVGDWNGDGYTEMGTVRLNPADNKYYWSVDYNRNGVWDGIAGGDQKWILGKPGDLPVSGDWNGNGYTEMGTFRLNTTDNLYYWSLDYNGNGLWDGKAADRQFVFGTVGDVPVIGKW